MKEIVDFLKNNNNFLITAHINADGDAYASVLAVGQILKKLNKNYVIILPDEAKEEKYDFLPYFEEIKNFNDEWKSDKFDAAIICDAPGASRIPGVIDLLPDHEKRLKIDHHPPEGDIASFTLVDEHAGSASKLVYNIFETLGLPNNKELATIFYTGISYDTGRFSYSNTSAEDYKIASKLMLYDIDIAEINRRLFMNTGAEALKVIGFGLYTLKQFANGKINVIIIPNDKMGNIRSAEIEELATHSVSVKNAEVGIFIREVRPGKHKISLRSVHDVPVNDIAVKFNGGGHKKAAGCHFAGDTDTLVKMLVEEVEKYL